MTKTRDRIERKIGQKVMCNGYPGTITRVCEWSATMVEVRLARGLVCVGFSELLARADEPHSQEA